MPAKIKRAPRRPNRARHLDGVAPWTLVKNQRTDKKYVLVNRELAGQVGGPGYYEALGYSYVRKGEHGEEFMAGTTCKEGDVLESQGSVLMCIDKEEWERQLREGRDFGASGSQRHDAVMDSIIDRGTTGFDPLRGIHGLRKPGGGAYVGFVNETTPLQESADGG